MRRLVCRTSRCRLITDTRTVGTKRGVGPRFRVNYVVTVYPVCPTAYHPRSVLRTRGTVRGECCCASIRMGKRCPMGVLGC